MQPKIEHFVAYIEKLLKRHTGQTTEDLCGQCMLNIPCGRATFKLALTILTDTNTVYRVGSKRNGYRYYITRESDWDSHPMVNKTIPAAEAPRVVGERLSPMAWTIKHCVGAA